MDEVRFDLRRIQDDPFKVGALVVDVFVNDRELAWLAGRHQRPAAPDDSASLAGEYVGLLIEVLDGPPSKHFMGSSKSHLYCGPNEKTVLLGCECLEPGCWPLMAHVEVDDSTVKWTDFEQPHRGASWGYAGLEFTFDRNQYEDALSAIDPRT